MSNPVGNPMAGRQYLYEVYQSEPIKLQHRIMSFHRNASILSLDERIKDISIVIKNPEHRSDVIAFLNAKIDMKDDGSKDWSRLGKWFKKVEGSDEHVFLSQEAKDLRKKDKAYKNSPEYKKAVIENDIKELFDQWNTLKEEVVAINKNKTPVMQPQLNEWVEKLQALEHLSPENTIYKEQLIDILYALESNDFDFLMNVDFNIFNDQKLKALGLDESIFCEINDLAVRYAMTEEEVKASEDKKQQMKSLMHEIHQLKENLKTFAPKAQEVPLNIDPPIVQENDTNNNFDAEQILADLEGFEGYPDPTNLSISGVYEYNPDEATQLLKNLDEIEKNSFVPLVQPSLKPKFAPQDLDLALTQAISAAKAELEELEKQRIDEMAQEIIKKAPPKPTIFKKILNVIVAPFLAFGKWFVKTFSWLFKNEKKETHRVIELESINSRR